MDLKDWLLIGIDLFKSISIWLPETKLRAPQPLVITSRNLKEALYLYRDKESCFYIFRPTGDPHPKIFDPSIKHYGIWHNNKGHLLEIEDKTLNDSFFYKIYGNPDFIKKLATYKQDIILSDCGNCLCYNDLITTGWCTTKIPGIKRKIYE